MLTWCCCRRWKNACCICVMSTACLGFEGLLGMLMTSCCSWRFVLGLMARMCSQPKASGYSALICCTCLTCKQTQRGQRVHAKTQLANTPQASNSAGQHILLLVRSALPGSHVRRSSAQAPACCGMWWACRVPSPLAALHTGHLQQQNRGVVVSRWGLGR